MKKTFLFALALLCSIVSFAQGDWRVHPDEAKYKIYGTFETKFQNGRAYYELTEVNPVGFNFETINSIYYGTKSRRGDVYFTFDHVTYKGNPDLDNIGLWVYNEATNKWDADSETDSRQGADNETKDMEVMLVLDCSTSLSDNAFEQAKNSAISFINEMLRESSAGNIHIGIIGFSSWERTKVRQIEQLTSSSSMSMKSFINGLTKGGGTALFRSYDEAFDMLNSYSTSLDKNKFAGAAIVTFTDGLDNGSINESKEIGNKKNYFNYIKNNVLQKTIKGVPYLSYTIFLPGGADVKDKAREYEAVEDLKALAKQDDHYFRVNNASELEYQFKLIARSLIDSWKIIQCFIAPGQNGKVCWTFGKKEVKEVKIKEPIKRKSFIGFNGTVGFPMVFGQEDSYLGTESGFGIGVNFKVGLDMAWRVSRKFAIGTYFNVGSGFTSGDWGGANVDFKIGLLMLAGDINEKPFIIGIAPCTGFGFSGYHDEYYNLGTYYSPNYVTYYDERNGYLPFELRLGRAINKHLYITGNLNIGIPTDLAFTLEPGLSIGYRFGK